MILYSAQSIVVLLIFLGCLWLFLWGVACAIKLTLKRMTILSARRFKTVTARRITCLVSVLVAFFAIAIFLSINKEPSKIAQSLHGADYIEVNIIGSNRDGEIIKLSENTRVLQMARAMADSSYKVYVLPFVGFSAGELYLISVFSNNKKVKQFALVGNVMSIRGFIFYECEGLKSAFDDILDSQGESRSVPQGHEKK